MARIRLKDPFRKPPPLPPIREFPKEPRTPFVPKVKLPSIYREEYWDRPIDIEGIRERIPTVTGVVQDVASQLGGLDITIVQPTLYKPLDIGVDLPEGWQVKLTPAENEQGFTFSIIEPEGYELFADEAVLSPGGEVFTPEQLRAVEIAQERGLLEVPEGIFYGIPGLPKREFVQPKITFTDAFGRIFPDIEFEEFVDYFFPEVPDIEGLPPRAVDLDLIVSQVTQQKRFQEFIDIIREFGKSPATEALVGFLFPGVSDAEREFMLTAVEPVGEEPLPIDPIPDNWTGSNVAWVEQQIGRKLSFSEILGNKPIPELGNKKWTMALAEAVATGGNLPRDIPYVSILDTAKVFGESLRRLPEQMAVAFLQATQGKDGASVVNPDWADEFIQKANEDFDAFIQDVAERFPDSKHMLDFAATAQNLSFSILSMGTGLAVGVPTAIIPIPGARVAAYAAGTAASGFVAYQITSYHIMQQYLEMMNEEKIDSTGTGLTLKEEERLKKEFSARATQYGLWEAIPEALSNLAFVRLLAPLKGIVGKFAPELVRRVTGIYATELITETITQKGQSDIEVIAGLRDKRINLIEAFQEVAPQTFILTTIMAGAGTSVVSIKNAVAKAKDSLKREIGEDSPLYPELERVIEEQLTETIREPTPTEVAEVEKVAFTQPTDRAIKWRTKIAEGYVAELTITEEGKYQVFSPYPKVEKIEFDNFEQAIEKLSEYGTDIIEVNLRDKTSRPFQPITEEIPTIERDISETWGVMGEPAQTALAEEAGIAQTAVGKKFTELTSVQQDNLRAVHERARVTQPTLPIGEAKADVPVQTRRDVAGFEVMTDEEGNIVICG